MQSSSAESPSFPKAASGGWVTSLQFSLFTQAQLPVIHCQASLGSHSRVQWSHIAGCCCSQSNYNLWFSMWQWCATYSVSFKHRNHANAKDIVNLAPVNTAHWTERESFKIARRAMGLVLSVLWTNTATWDANTNQTECGPQLSTLFSIIHHTDEELAAKQVSRRWCFPNNNSTEKAHRCAKHQSRTRVSNLLRPDWHWSNGPGPGVRECWSAPSPSGAPSESTSQIRLKVCNSSGSQWRER